MQYMLLIHVDEDTSPSATPAQQAQMTEPYSAYNRALEKAGILVAAERLTSASQATQMRVRDGRTEVVDGPFAEAKEQIGGFYIIEVQELEEALKWAARCPGASHGTVEVRAIAGMRS